MILLLTFASTIANWRGINRVGGWGWWAVVVLILVGVLLIALERYTFPAVSFLLIIAIALFLTGSVVDIIGDTGNNDSRAFYIMGSSVVAMNMWGLLSVRRWGKQNSSLTMRRGSSRSRSFGRTLGSIGRKIALIRLRRNS